MGDFPQLVNVGFGGVLVNFSDVLSEGANRAALSFREAVESLSLVGIEETTTSLTATYIAFDPHKLPRDELRATLQDLLETADWLVGALPQNRRLWRIPTCFDGPQFEEAIALAGVDAAIAISEICAEQLRVMTIGFAPGLPYLGSLPENWNIPRQSGITKEVPVGALCVAIRQFVLFPTASPTGWRHIANCAFRGFQVDASEPFALSPGDEIRFHPVNGAEFKAMEQTEFGGATWEALQ